MEAAKRLENEFEIIEEIDEEIVAIFAEWETPDRRRNIESLAVTQGEYDGRYEF